MQRGPIAHLLALENDELDPVRFYALHRMIRAAVMAETPARAAGHFDLDEAIAKGQLDFGQGELIGLEIRVRGYLAGVVDACPMAADQRVDDEPAGSDFRLRHWTRVPSSGLLLRWLLAVGDNLEVVNPPDLRRIFAAQTL
ncbi:WYL domain-containing protein [Thiorhodococcus mannitoliphagus]|uniref:WYL domain-containing protein n=1 Tax=Thiorhodococcus mannitoliphagus TaxID=329406 RepID=UPI0030B8BA5A